MPPRPTTFLAIFMPTQAGFDATGLTDDELSEAIEAEIKAYRVETKKDAYEIQAS